MCALVYKLIYFIYLCICSSHKTVLVELTPVPIVSSFLQCAVHVAHIYFSSCISNSTSDRVSWVYLKKSFFRNPSEMAHRSGLFFLNLCVCVLVCKWVMLFIVRRSAGFYMVPEYALETKYRFCWSARKRCQVSYTTRNTLNITSTITVIFWWIFTFF